MILFVNTAQLVNLYSGLVGEELGPDGDQQFNPDPFDEISFTLEDGDSKRVFYMRNPTKTSPYEDITNQVSLDDDGYPRIMDLKAQASRILAELIRIYEP